MMTHRRCMGMDRTLPSLLSFIRTDEEGEADDGCVDEGPTPGGDPHDF